jgi:O-antigen/teichoic acid export membrane protein
VLLVANGASGVLGLIRGFYVARTMIPADYGAWSLISALLSYANYGDVGINTGFILEVPSLIGGGRLDEAERAQRQAYTATIIVAGIVATLVLVSSFGPARLVGGYQTSLRIIAAGVVVFALQNYYQVVTRIQNRWEEIGFATVATTFVGLAGVMVAGITTGHLSVDTAALFSVLGTAAAVLILGYVCPTAPAYPPDWALFRRLMAIGLPIALVPIASTVFQNVDRWIVASAVSRTQMGYYGLGTTLGLFLYMVPNTLAIVLFTKQIAAFGATGDPRTRESIVLLPIQFSGYVMALIAGAMMLAMPFIIHYLTPAYGPALRVARLQVVANCLLFVVPVGVNYLISTGQRRRMVVIVVAAALFEAALVAVLVRTKLEIEGAAWAVVVSDAIYSGAVAVFCLRAFRTGALVRARRAVLYFMPFGLCIPVALLLQPFNDVGGTLALDVGRLVVLGVAYGLLSGALCLAVARISGFLAEPFVTVLVKTQLPVPLAMIILGKG